MLVAGGVRVKLRYADGFRLRSRQTTLRAPSDDSRSFFEAALELIQDLDVNEPIRLVGVAAFDLTPRDAGKQLGLFGPTEAEQQSELERTVDQIKARFGDKIDFGSG